MISYNIRSVKEKVRRIVVGNHQYYLLKDILDYYGYKSQWWQNHKKEILDSHCNVIKKSLAMFGSNSSGNFVNWYCFNRLITIFAFIKISGIASPSCARTLTAMLEKDINLDELVLFCGENNSYFDMINKINDFLDIQRSNNVLMMVK